MENIWETQKALNLTAEDLVKLAENSIKASFIEASLKQELIAEIKSVQNRHLQKLNF